LHPFLQDEILGTHAEIYYLSLGVAYRINNRPEASWSNWIVAAAEIGHGIPPGKEVAMYGFNWLH